MSLPSSTFLVLSFVLLIVLPSLSLPQISINPPNSLRCTLLPDTFLLNLQSSTADATPLPPSLDSPGLPASQIPPTHINARSLTYTLKTHRILRTLSHINSLLRTPSKPSRKLLLPPPPPPNLPSLFAKILPSHPHHHHLNAPILPPKPLLPRMARIPLSLLFPTLNPPSPHAVPVHRSGRLGGVCF